MVRVPEKPRPSNRERLISTDKLCAGFRYVVLCLQESHSRLFDRGSLCRSYYTYLFLAVCYEV